VNPDRPLESILRSCRGFLFDLDGVFFVGRAAIPGAADTIRFLREHGIPRRYTTNTTTRSRATLHRELLGMGLPIDPEEIISAPQAAILHLRRLGSPVCRLLLDGDTLADFAEFRQDVGQEVMVSKPIYLVRDDAEFRAAVAAQPGYDVTEMGHEVPL